jgi:hypothetical protein
MGSPSGIHGFFVHPLIERGLFHDILILTQGTGAPVALQLIVLRLGKCAEMSRSSIQVRCGGHGG